MGAPGDPVPGCAFSQVPRKLTKFPARRFEIPATQRKKRKNSLQPCVGNSAKSFSKNSALQRDEFARTAQNEKKSLHFPCWQGIFQPETGFAGLRPPPPIRPEFSARLDL